MTAPIMTRFGTPIPADKLEVLATATRGHLERPVRHARYGNGGQLWERLAEQDTTPPILPSWLWDGGRPVDDDDLWRKQRDETDLAGDR